MGLAAPQHLISRLARTRPAWFVEEPLPCDVPEPRLCTEEHGPVTRVWLEVPGTPAPVLGGEGHLYWEFPPSTTMSPSSRCGRRSAMTASTAGPALTISRMRRGRVSAATNSSTDSVPVSGPSGPCASMNSLVRAVVRLCTAIGMPREATLRARFWPMTARPVRPKAAVAGTGAPWTRAVGEGHPTCAAPCNRGVPPGSVARMARARLTADERRTQLLEVAGGLFADLGYHGLSMETLAEAAGVSKPVLYQHFPSKRELYLALVHATIAEMEAQVRKALDGTSDNRARVYGAIGAYVDFVEDRRFPLLFGPGGPADDAEVARVVQDAEERLAEAVGSIIAADAGLGMPAALLLSSALRGLALDGARWWREHGGVDKPEAVRLLSRLAWRGIGGFPE